MPVEEQNFEFEGMQSCLNTRINDRFGLLGCLAPALWETDIRSWYGVGCMVVWTVAQ